MTTIGEVIPGHLVPLDLRDPKVHVAVDPNRGFCEEPGNLVVVSGISPRDVPAVTSG